MSISDMEKKPIVFETEISVQVNHLNYGNHLGYDSLLGILHEARLRWLKTLSPSASEINIENNIGWVVKELHLYYQSEAKHGDELKINLSISNQTRIGFTLEHDVENKTTGEILCHGKILLVCFDFNRSKPSRIPKILEKIMVRTAPISEL